MNLLKKLGNHVSDKLKDVKTKYDDWNEKLNDEYLQGYLALERGEIDEIPDIPSADIFDKIRDLQSGTKEKKLKKLSKEDLTSWYEYAEKVEKMMFTYLWMDYHRGKIWQIDENIFLQFGTKVEVQLGNSYNGIFLHYDIVHVSKIVRYIWEDDAKTRYILYKENEQYLKNTWVDGRITINDCFICKENIENALSNLADTNNFESANKGKLTEPEIIIALITKIAKSDGIISELEAEIIKFIIDDFVNTSGLDESSKKSYKTILVRMHKVAKDDDKEITYYASKLLSSLNADEKLNIINQLITIAIIDGINTTKKEMIFKVGQLFKISQQYIQNQIDKTTEKQQYDDSSYSSTNKDPYEIIGCSSTDDAKTIKKKYRELVRKFHPDFIEGKGLDEEFIQFANNKLKEINAAYETIKRKKKFN